MIEREERLFAVKLAPKLFRKPYLDLNRDQQMAVGILAGIHCRGKEQEREKLDRILKEIQEIRDSRDSF